MDDYLDEEVQIANEQDSQGTTLCSESFLDKIHDLTIYPVISFDENTSLGTIIDLMQSKNIGSVVLTHNNELSGILTERDILMKVIGKFDNWQDIKANEVMTHSPQALRKSDEIAYALNNMHVGGFRHIPIVDENNIPISMVSIKDVVNWILDHFPREITNLTGEPFRGKPTREGG